MEQSGYDRGEKNFGMVGSVERVGYRLEHGRETLRFFALEQIHSGTLGAVIGTQRARQVLIHLSNEPRDRRLLLADCLADTWGFGR